MNVSDVLIYNNNRNVINFKNYFSSKNKTIEKIKLILKVVFGERNFSCLLSRKKKNFLT